MVYQTFSLILHLEYVKANPSAKMIVDTFDKVMMAFKSADFIKSCGGGMIGSLFAFVFNWAFSIDGIIIAVITLIVIGLILIFNTSILSLIAKIKLPKLRNKEEDEEDEDSNEEEVIDNRVVISSIDEITNKKEDKEEDNDIPIKRDIDKLPVEGRPLSQTRDLEEMYRERLPLYQAAADTVLENV